MRSGKNLYLRFGVEFSTRTKLSSEPVEGCVASFRDFESVIQCTYVNLSYVDLNWGVDIMDAVRTPDTTSLYSIDDSVTVYGSNRDFIVNKSDYIKDGTQLINSCRIMFVGILQHKDGTHYTESDYRNIPNDDMIDMLVDVCEYYCLSSKDEPNAKNHIIHDTEKGYGITPFGTCRYKTQGYYDRVIQGDKLHTFWTNI